MSIGLYDNAFLDKLKNWTNNTAINIVGPDEYRRLIETIADNTNDSPIKLPFISLKRAGGFTILTTGKRPLSFTGATLEATNDRGQKLNAIPISIPYQIDVYTRYLSEADELIRNLVFNIINYPKLTVTIPYHGVDFKHDSNIRLQGEVDDNSSIPERLIPGQFTRMSIKIDIDDAYLYDIQNHITLKICENPSVVTEDMDEYKDTN